MQKRVAPAALRNREPILQVLAPLVEAGHRVLEVASGSGQHVEHFARQLPQVVFQPTDLSQAALASIDAYRTEAFLKNVLPARHLDAGQTDWDVGSEFDGVLCVNMIHIAPWEATVGLFQGARRIVAPSGWLLTYGPYRFGGEFTAPSNAAFDQSLRAENPRWGVRDVDDLERLARDSGWSEPEVTALPANNHTLLFRAH